MNQKTALQILQSGANVFLTGAAGTGKTYVLNEYIAQLREHGIPVAITASTGIAATHIGGQTIHSWSGMGIREVFHTHDLEKIAKKKAIREKIETTQVLIIDEISMISRKMIENIDTVLRYIRLSEKPFGGLQMILCGDFFQLPPVTKTPLPNTQKFAFMSPLWGKAGFKVCYLDEQFRQDQDDLASFLNEMRSGEISESRSDQIMECIQRTHEVTPETQPIRLYTHNADVDLINNQSLLELKTPTVSFSGIGKGEKQLVEMLKKSILVHERVSLKKGAPVMFIKNNPKEGYFNGTLGTITDFSEDGFPIVTTRDNRDITVTHSEWSITNSFGEAMASYAQIPLRLAWAITVHKSQGMTLEEAEMDLSRTFESGQGYVALSRVKGWDGLRLLGCNNNAMQMDPLVLQADRRFQELSREVEKEEEMNTDIFVQKRFEDRIKKLGGTLDRKEREKNKALQEKKPEQKKISPKVSTYVITKRLLEEKKDIEAIMSAREMSEDTIIKHIEHLIQEDPFLDIDHIKPEKKDMAKMTLGFIMAEGKAKKDDRDSDGNVKLRFVFETLKEEYFYRDLKRARLFMTASKLITKQQDEQR